MKHGLRVACSFVGWVLIAAGVVSGLGAFLDGETTFAEFDVAVGVVVGAVLVWTGSRLARHER
jgi:hypothetical protein